eukprot:CAMPEP_0196144326 /NCGR_PEP_ID=MMETSP0910-20130528/15885_1 /TAXON_ID=49265 /ORGANISM="Thalassiosira rotula, Strain GSO102" /LENGTH=555 /DNA_ID=CAMNT_0041405953 /DNA_START=13 /DNA_END=1677 /DNA_ORIENTATION=+
MTTAAGVSDARRQRQPKCLHLRASSLALFSFAIAANSLSLNSKAYSSIRGVHHHNSRYANPHQPQFVPLGELHQSSSCAPSRNSPTRLRHSSPAIEDGDNVDQTASDDSSKSKLSGLDLSVPAVLLAAFLNLLGFTMASPIQPALGKHFSLPLGASFGSLSSAYPLGMLVGVFLWPTLSDIVGRKLVMSVTLMGSGLGLMLQSWGIHRHWTLEQFLAARVLTGLFAGNSPISKAYLADKGTLAKKGDLAKYLAWKDAASTLAFIVGPALGGLLFTLFGHGSPVDVSKQISCVILCSAVASIFASLSLMVFMKNVQKDDGVNQKTNGNNSKQTSNTVDNDKVDSKDKSESKQSNSGITACPLGTRLWTGVASVACVSALYHAADSAFFAFFPPLLQNRLNFSTQAVGMAFTSFAFVSFFMSAFVSSRFMRAFGPVASCTTGLAAVGSGLMALGCAASLSMGVSVGVTGAFILGAAGLYYAGVPLYGPSVPTMLLQCVPSHKRGAVMGFDGAVNTMARVVSPLIMGEIHRVKGAGACFKVAGSCVYVAALLALFRRW